MSSKLVKKGLDFVVSTEEKSQKIQKGKIKKTKRDQRTRNSPYKSKSKKSKVKTQQEDFTEQNLQYFKRSTWTMKKDVYDKIVKNQDKSLKTAKDVEDLEDKDDVDEE